VIRRTALALAVLALAAAAGVATLRESRRAARTGAPVSLAGGERCRSCHSLPREDPGGAHAADAVGCEACHLGDPLALDAERAHAGLEREPGALDTVRRTCGREGCHPDQAARVAASPMATARGLVAVDRWALGEAPAPDGLSPLADVLAAVAPTAAEDHLRRLCAGCHLGTRAANRDDAVREPGSGCGACHATRRPPGTTRPHVPVDARVPDDRCLGCHSRSARISLAYAGLAELRPGDPAADTVLFDGRPARRLPGDVHHDGGAGCTDCHGHRDLMGDGAVHLHQEDAVGIRCQACHGPVDPGEETVWGLVDDAPTVTLLRLRGQERPAGEPVRTARGVPLWNLRPGWAVPGSPAAPWALWPKAGGPPRPARATPDDAAHRMRGHERLSCQACHSAWIPWCADCHTRRTADGHQWDFGTGAEAPGRWIEDARLHEALPPALGLREGRVVPVAPGMAMTVDAGDGADPRDVRLFAAWDPHTTRRPSRTCASCHGDPRALAWPEGTLGTRRTLAPLDAAARARAAAVAPCLPCHGGAEDPLWRDWPAGRDRLAAGAAPACNAPRNASTPLRAPARPR
jgi:hypothetical protein